MKPSAILSFGAILLGATTPVEASQCKTPPCGRFENSTPWTAKWADLGMKDHLCQLSSGGKPVKCKQYFLGANSSRGGFFHKPRTDVDAFCFADRTYYVKFGPRGSEKAYKKGVWIKINSAQTAKCVARNGVPHCTVNWLENNNDDVKATIVMFNGWKLMTYWMKTYLFHVLDKLVYVRRHICRGVILRSKFSVSTRCPNWCVCRDAPNFTKLDTQAVFSIHICMFPRPNGKHKEGSGLLDIWLDYMIPGWLQVKENIKLCLPSLFLPFTSSILLCLGTTIVHLTKNCSFWFYIVHYYIQLFTTWTINLFF